MLAWYREGCVADGAAPGAGTEEGTSFHVTSLIAISLADHPLRMCDVMNRNGQRVYCPLSAAADFSQQHVKREWFGDHAIARITASRSTWGWPPSTITRDVRRGRLEFGQHGEAGLLWQHEIEQHRRYPCDASATR